MKASSQNGSVLLTLVIGLILLSLLGTGMVSMMTSSTMTNVSDRTGSQAYYLAETGISILRDSFSALDGPDMLSMAEKLEQKAITIPAPESDTSALGTVTLSFVPRWFHSTTGWTHLPDSAAELPSQDRSLMLAALPRNGSPSLIELNTPTASAAIPDYADLYLVGRLKSAVVTGASSGPWKLVVTSADNTRDFDRYPAMNGMISLVDASGNISLAKRFLYRKMTLSGSTATFEGITSALRSPGTSNDLVQSDLNSRNLVLGQYFQITSVAETANGGKAALTYHTNGKNSFRSATSDGENTVTEVVGGSGSLDGKGGLFNNDLFSTDSEHMVGKPHFTGQGDGYSITLNAFKNGYAQASTNHFLKQYPSEKDSPDYWFAALATQPLASSAVNLDSMVQLSLRDTPQNRNSPAYYCAGLLFRLACIGGDSLNNNLGVQGLGLAAVSGQIRLSSLDASYYKVTASSVSPALLPGFSYVPKSGFFKISKDNVDAVYYNQDHKSTDKGDILLTLRPRVVLWAYNDTGDSANNSNGTSGTLQWLAVAEVTNTDLFTGNGDDFYSKLVLRVQEKDGKNKIRVWLASQYATSAEAGKGGQTLVSVTDSVRMGFTPGGPVQWPLPSALETTSDTDYFTLLEWSVINRAVYNTVGEDKTAATKELTISTTMATGNRFLQTGIFSERYGKENQSSDGSLFMRDFAFGRVGSQDNESQSGLTPGIIQ